jgi:hypothetical protein
MISRRGILDPNLRYDILDMARVRGTCRICGYQGMLDPHHIISQAQCKKLNRRDLISNPGNVVHICRHCHDLTTASEVRQYLDKKDMAHTAFTAELAGVVKAARKRNADWMKKKKAAKQAVKDARRERKAKKRCEAMTGLMGRCKRTSKPGEHVCGFHLKRRKPGFRRKWHREDEE